MNKAEAIEYLEEVSNLGSIYGTGRMEILLENLGNPDKKLKYIHVAGTNGKGSTASMLSSILTKAGFKVGLFTSPHLIDYNERIKICGNDISDEDFCRAAAAVKEAAAPMRDQVIPTVFERITAMGVYYFWEQKCDIVILEVGLGGRLDATNVIEAPELSVICRLDLEHTELLGNTIEEIAGEKGGIIKPGCPVVLYGQTKEAEGVIKNICEEKGCELVITDQDKAELILKNDDGQVINYRDRKDIKLALVGSYQLNNALTVLDAVDVLKKKYDISEEAIYEGLRDAKWPGRFAIHMRNPYLLVDGAHNPNGATELARGLKDYFPGMKFTFMFGVMADKDYDGMIDKILFAANKFITVTPKNYRALDSAALKEEIESKFGVPAIDAHSVEEGVEEALKCREAGENICIFGSLYQVGDILKVFEEP